jgi:hypothetical protein
MHYFSNWLYYHQHNGEAADFCEFSRTWPTMKNTNSAGNATPEKPPKNQGGRQPTD